MHSSSKPLEIPDFMETGWSTLTPEADEETRKRNQEMASETTLRRQRFARVFDNPDGREMIGMLRAKAREFPRYMPGWTADQTATAVVRRDAILDMLEFIEQQVELFHTEVKNA